MEHDRRQHALVNGTGTPSPYAEPPLSATTFTIPTEFVAFPQLSHGHSVSIQSGGVATASLTFSNTSGTYLLSGGPIQGPTSLVLSGGGTLVLANSNAYTGGTNLQEGTLIVNNPYALPAGTSLTVGAGGDVHL